MRSTPHACGYCLEDRVASVYDHALLSRALTRITASVQGVDPGSEQVGAAISRRRARYCHGILRPGASQRSGSTAQ
jgi:hypothetical protein